MNIKKIVFISVAGLLLVLVLVFGIFTLNNNDKTSELDGNKTNGEELKDNKKDNEKDDLKDDVIEENKGEDGKVKEDIALNENQIDENGNKKKESMIKDEYVSPQETVKPENKPVAKVETEVRKDSTVTIKGDGFKISGNINKDDDKTGGNKGNNVVKKPSESVVVSTDFGTKPSEEVKKKPTEDTKKVQEIYKGSKIDNLGSNKDISSAFVIKEKTGDENLIMYLKKKDVSILSLSDHSNAKERERAAEAVVELGGHKDVKVVKDMLNKMYGGNNQSEIKKDGLHIFFDGKLNFRW